MKRILSIGKDDFYPQIFRLAVPIIIQNLLSAAVNSADVIMLNYVGQSAISAVSLAANYSNILFMVYYGIGTGASLLCSQYAGKKDFQAIHVVEGIALRFSVLISLLVALVPPISALWALPISAGESRRSIWQFFEVLEE